jgi:hypothetical protein
VAFLKFTAKVIAMREGLLSVSYALGRAQERMKKVRVQSPFPLDGGRLGPMAKPYGLR